MNIDTMSIYNVDKYVKDFLISEQGMNFLLEVSTTPGGGDVDDGPRYYYGNNRSYKVQSDKMAKRIGMEVVRYLIDDEYIETYDTDPPKGPPKSVTFYPAGVEGVKFAGTNYMRDIKSSEAFIKYVEWVRRVAMVAGHSFVDFVDAELSKDNDKETIDINLKSKK